jgi:predicted flap endonuclease-1-like 5' DNA nuclease
MMDSRKELEQLYAQIDKLKDQSLEYLKRNVRGQKKREEIHERIEELLSRVKALLEGKAVEFEDEVRRHAGRLRLTPGVRARESGLTRIKGIGSTFVQGLQEIGVTTPEKLLKLGASSRSRRKLGEELGISERVVLNWVNSADLMRIKGVGEEYTYLLDEAGVDTVPELAQRNPANLYQKMAEVNQQKRLVRRLPSEAEVEDWIAQAKKLPRVIHY